MKQLFLLLLTVLFLSSCEEITLDSLAFPSQSLDYYEFENYDGELSIPDTMLADASNYTLVEMNSLDQQTGESYKIYGLYIGDTSNIATDTIVLYAHGQSLHMDNYFSRASLLANVGGKYNYGVFMYDFRGYGMSEGASTEMGLFEDGDAAIDWLKSHGANPNKTIYYGYSLGAIPLIDRAAYREDFKPSKLIVEAPIASVQYLVDASTGINVYSDFVTSLEFESAEKMRDVDAELLWLHGKADTYIAIENGEMIYSNYMGSYKRAIRVEGAEHSLVPSTMGYVSYLNDLLDFIRY
ncbi:alpha/beta hydrolase [Crocinitomicaceae bacterium]|nr:alpha/beta hydrolase [Crocinitomicaceae bacterium]